MTNIDQTEARRHLPRVSVARRPTGLQGLVQGLFFAAAFGFTAAMVLGVVH